MMVSTVGAWKVVMRVLEVKRNQDAWSCRACQKEINHEILQFHACDSCLDWFYLGCVGLKCEPKRKALVLQILLRKRLK